MLATLLIVFREVIEAGLIVGIVLAATKGVPGRGLWVSMGVAGGLAGACVVAAFAGPVRSHWPASASREAVDRSLPAREITRLSAVPSADSRPRICSMRVWASCVRLKADGRTV